MRCRRARDLFFMDSKGDVRQFFWLVSLAGASGPSFFAWLNPAAVWMFCPHLQGTCCCSGVSQLRTKGWREVFFGVPFAWQVLESCGATAEYLAIVYVFLVRVSCDVGGLETCFLWIPKVTFGSFSGLCFASLWHESCCCLRLSETVFQGQISRWFRSESRRAFTWL